MKKTLCLMLFGGLSNFIYASGTYVEDGYHTQIPCFRLNIKSPTGNETKFDYILLQNNNGKKLQAGTVVANKDGNNIIQWCDNDSSHVQKLGNLNFDSNYTLLINGIKFKGFIVGTSVSIKTLTKASSFVNIYRINHTPYSDSVALDKKDINVGEEINIQYNDIIRVDNALFQHTQFGTQMSFSGVPLCPVSDPVCGDNMNYKPSDSRTRWGFSLFRKTWLMADVVIPENLSSYHSVNTRNLKFLDTAKDFDAVYKLYDNNDKDTDNLIQLNIKYNHQNSNHVADNLRNFFAGFCSGIGVIDNVVYASCRKDKDTSSVSNIYPENVIRQVPTHLSYKTACQMYTEVYQDSKYNITSALLRTNSSGALECANYRSDFPQGDYLKSCTGVNYQPEIHQLVTDCYDDKGGIKHSVTTVGLTGISTPRYKNVNGSLVAY